MRPFTFTFYLSLLVHLSIWAQPLDACYPEVSFTGNAAQTLCEQYGSILPDHTIGVTGSVKASDIGEELSGNILIAGDFYIDRPFLFYDAIIRIVPGAAIKLSAPPSAPGGESGGGGLGTLPFLSKLTIDNSKLFACNDLWEGIIVYPRTAIFLRNHTVIEDAETVVRAQNASNAVIDFIHTTLNRNRIGIELASSLSPPPVLANFYGVNFTCTAPLNGTVDEVGFAGIRTDRTSFSIGGVPGFPNNVFKGMEYGIYSGGGNVTISLRGAYFEGLKRSGIFMTHGSLYTDHVGMMDCGPRMLEIRRVVNCTMRNTRFTFADPVEIPVGSLWHLVYLHGFMPSAILNISESNFENISGSALRRIGLRFDGTDMGDLTKVYIHDNEFDGIGIQYFGASSKHVTIHIENNDFDSGDALSIIGGDKYNVKIIGNDFSNSAGITLGGAVLGVENEF